MRIALIGKEDVIAGFGLFGIKTFPVETSDEAKTRLEEIINNEYTMVFITEDLAAGIAKDIRYLLENTNACISILPGMVPMPSMGTGSDIMLDMIKDSLRRALGAEVGG